MRPSPTVSRCISLAFTISCAAAAAAFQPQGPPPREGERPPGQQGPQGPRGPGGPMMQDRRLIPRFDADGDGRLNTEERRAAREFIRSEAAARPRGPGGGGGGRGFRPPGMEEEATPSPGPRIDKAQVAPADGPLYDERILRTLFLDFESDDWEAELSDFIRTDVEVPATLTVDGVAYPGVGVSFRGASSLMMVGPGSKRSFNISIDHTDKKQRLQGYETLNLLSSHADPTFMHTVLYFHVAQAMGIPAPRANFVRVVVNGESWGLYINAQQFNRDMLSEHFKSSKGARWKAPGSPRGRAGLEYLGEDIEPYRALYEIKSDDKEEHWRALIDLCRTLNETPIDQLQAALEPMLDIDGTLRFLALENALVNSDGYWIRASDYGMFRDKSGVFHLIPHDANETFQPAMGRGRGGMGGPRDGAPGDAPPPQEDRTANPGARPDPLIGLDDPAKPLRSRLLQVPALRARYLGYVKEIAEEWLDWRTLGPLVADYRALIEDEVKADTRKFASYETYVRAIEGPVEAADAAAPDRRRARPSLEQFAEQRRAYLLDYCDRALGASD